MSQQAGSGAGGRRGVGADRPVPPAPLLLRDATVIVDAGEPAIVGEAVAVDGRIVAVGPAGEVAEREGARVIYLGGLTVMPGLVDARAGGGRALSSPRRRTSTCASRWPPV